MKITMYCSNCGLKLEKEVCFRTGGLKLAKPWTLVTTPDNTDFQPSAAQEFLACSEKCYQELYKKYVLSKCKQASPECNGEVQACETCSYLVCETHRSQNYPGEIICKECVAKNAEDKAARWKKDTAAFLEDYDKALKIIKEQKDEVLPGSKVVRMIELSIPLKMDACYEIILGEKVVEYYRELQSGETKENFIDWFCEGLED